MRCCRLRWTLACLVLWPLPACEQGEPDACHARLHSPCSGEVPGSLDCSLGHSVVWSQDPNDPLYPGSPGFEPVLTSCDLSRESCAFTCQDAAGLSNQMDVICRAQAGGPVLARASSQPGQLAQPADLDLLFGPVDTFVDATVLRGTHPGQCSGLAQDGGRFGHTATLLDDGRVLIAGGIRRLGAAEEFLATVEVFDPRTGVHAVLTGPDALPLRMAAPAGRAFHTATRLPDGRVLLAGGVSEAGSPPRWTSLRSAELFDPATGAFGSPMDMGEARAQHTATLLATGEVLLTGGAVYDGEGTITTYLDSAALFDPDAGVWRPVGNSMTDARAFHQAVLLDPQASGGRVLVLGGEGSAGVLDSVDVYRPEDNTFFDLAGNAPRMAQGRSRFCATRDGSGQVLVVGGATSTAPLSATASLEVYDAAAGAAGAFTLLGVSLGAARQGPTCSRLEDGSVLVVGGLGSDGRAAGPAELLAYVGPALTVAALPDPRNPARFLHAATALANGWVLLTGGLGEATPDAAAIAQSVLFVPRLPFALP
jgi:hypothetical protein